MTKDLSRGMRKVFRKYIQQEPVSYLIAEQNDNEDDIYA